MPLAETGTANDDARLDLLHEASCSNYESPSAKFADALALEIDRAHPKHLDEMIRRVWAACAEGKLDADTAGELDQRARERQWRPRPPSQIAPTAICRAREPRSLDRQASIERRRRLARVSPVPSDLVDKFTQGELAVITVVAGEIGRAGACLWCLDRIAAVAGVCKTLARNAIAKARALGLLISVQRRRRGQKSLTNVVRALRKSWAELLVRIGCRKSRSGDQEESRIGNGEPPGETAKRLFEVASAKALPRTAPG